MVSNLKVDKIQSVAGNTTQITVAENAVHIPGHVIQTIFANASTEVAFSSNTYVDANVSASITPHFATSKILILSNLTFDNERGDTVHAKLLRNSTDIKEETYWNYDSGGSGTLYFVHRESHMHLDSPNTTSAITYKWQVKRTSGDNTNYVNYDDGTGETDSQIVLMEIAH